MRYKVNRQSFDYSKLDCPADRVTKKVDRKVVMLSCGCKLYSLAAYKKLANSKDRH